MPVVPSARSDDTRTRPSGRTRNGFASLLLCDTFSRISLMMSLSSRELTDATAPRAKDEKWIRRIVALQPIQPHFVDDAVVELRTERRERATAQRSGVAAM